MLESQEYGGSALEAKDGYAWLSFAEKAMQRGYTMTHEIRDGESICIIKLNEFDNDTGREAQTS